MVKTYSLKKDGNSRLSANFTVREFACHDGSDTILIDSDLVEGLQKIRDHFGKPIIINSAYRNARYNAKVGGSSKSYHVRGMAADIKISGVSAVELAYYAMTIFHGVGVYYYDSTEFIHVDTRNSIMYWLCAKAGKYEYHTKLMPTIRYGNISGRQSAVKFLQKKLGLYVDGIFGQGTLSAIKDLQKKNGLSVDGVVGEKTWKKLFCNGG